MPKRKIILRFMKTICVFLQVSIMCRIKYANSIGCTELTSGGFPRIRRPQVAVIRTRGRSWQAPWRIRNAARIRPTSGQTYKGTISSCADMVAFGHYKGSRPSTGLGLFPKTWWVPALKASWPRFRLPCSLC